MFEGMRVGEFKCALIAERFKTTRNEGSKDPSAEWKFSDELV